MFRATRVEGALGHGCGVDLRLVWSCDLPANAVARALGPISVDRYVAVVQNNSHPDSIVEFKAAPALRSLGMIAGVIGYPVCGAGSWSLLSTDAVILLRITTAVCAVTALILGCSTEIVCTHAAGSDARRWGPGKLLALCYTLGSLLRRGPMQRCRMIKLWKLHRGRAQTYPFPCAPRGSESMLRPGKSADKPRMTH